MSAVSLPETRNPILPAVHQLLATTDLFVDNFIGLSQFLTNEQRASQILMHAIAKILRFLDASDSTF